MQFARQHAKVRDFTSRHACLEVKFGFRQVQVCFIGGSLPVILSSMGKFKEAKRGISCQFKLEPEWTKSTMNKILKKIEMVKFITTALKC